MEMPNVITRFNGDNKFLSNFQASTFFYEGKKYATVEHAYQAMKSSDADEREAIRNAVAPSQAKKMGRLVKHLREDWDQVKVPLMKELLRLKFQNPFLRHKLLATGNAILIEGNTWKDEFWGVCKGNGLNMLGKLLMEIRDEIKKETEQDEATMQNLGDRGRSEE